MGTSRKTLQLDLLQLNALNFKSSSNTNIPSTFILSANGDGTTSFNPISSFMHLGYTTISVPGQKSLDAISTNLTLSFSTSTELFISTSYTRGIVWLDINATSTVTSTINSVMASTVTTLDNNLINSLINVNTILLDTVDNLGTLGYISTASLRSTVNGLGTIGYISTATLANTMASTMYNILTYPNIFSSIKYNGKTGLTNFSTPTDLSVSGTASFSSFQYNFNNFSQYINPNGSSRVFLEFQPNFTFSQVSAPSNISSVSLYPDGNSSIKDLLSISSHLVYYSTNTLPIIASGIQQYIPVTSLQPFGYSTNTRVLSNSFIQPMKMEIDSLLLNTNTSFGLQHYISDAVSYKLVDNSDISRTGLENSNVLINNSVGDRNSVFIQIYNSGNQF